MVENSEDVILFVAVELRVDFALFAVRVEERAIGDHGEGVAFVSFFLRQHVHRIPIMVHLLKCFDDVAELWREDEVIGVVLLPK